MIVGNIYNIRLGDYEDRYLCIRHDHIGFDLKRVRFPKTKIDAVRLPNHIQIVNLGSLATNPIKTKEEILKL